MDVYLAYAWHQYDEAMELVSIHATKAGAYRAARKRMFERISDQEDIWRGNRRYGFNYGLYGFHWRVMTVVVME